MAAETETGDCIPLTYIPTSEKRHCNSRDGTAMHGPLMTRPVPLAYSGHAPPSIMRVRDPMALQLLL